MPDFVQHYRQSGDDGRDDSLIVNVQAALERHYPGWAWYVEAPPSQNVLVIKNFDLGTRGKPWGFVLHKTQIDPAMECIMRAGGELLERYRQRRGPATTSALLDQRTVLFAKPDAA